MAGVPMRTPPGTMGRVSPGTVFLFTVMLHASITVCTIPVCARVSNNGAGVQANTPPLDGNR
jgi:hypothetical protein